MMIDVLRRMSPGRGGGSAIAVEAPPGVPDPSASDTLRARRRRLSEVFTPARPQLAHDRRAKPPFAPGDVGQRFIGRGTELARIMQALGEDRSHVILYAERARGKTSLANLATEMLRRQGFPVAHFTCSAVNDLDAIVRGLARDLPPRSLGIPTTAIPGVAGSEGAGPMQPGSESLLPPSPLLPGSVVALAPRLKDTRLVLVVDEFDRITDEATRTGLADAIKQVSDRGVPISFLVIGVSDSLEHLLGRHPSIQRCVTPIPLPLLGRADIERIVAEGGREVGLDYMPAVRAGIALLSRGVPYTAQLLSLRAGQSALGRGRTRVGGVDLAAAITAAVQEADPRVVVLHETLVAGGPDRAPVAALLRAVAGGVQDEFGRFRTATDPGAAPGGGLRVAGAPADPRAWQTLLETATVRPCIGAGPDVFTFGEAMLPQYVLLRTIHDRLLTAGVGRDVP